MRLLQQVKRWWQHRQLVDMLLEQFEAGNGVISESWARGTPIEAVLAWYDAQIASSRTPYGVSGLKLAILTDDGPPLYEVLLKRRTEWSAGPRDALAAVLAPLLAERDVTTAVISFGTALHHLLEQPRH